MHKVVLRTMLTHLHYHSVLEPFLHRARNIGACFIPKVRLACVLDIAMTLSRRLHILLAVGSAKVGFMTNKVANLSTLQTHINP